MHKKIAKAIMGSLTAATMLATSAAAFIPMSASAGQQLGQVDFDEGVGLPWHTCETNPAKQTFNISGGTYNVEIVTPTGSDGRWDLQLRHRGLKIASGHTYKISGEITPSESGWIYSKVGNYSGETELWHNISGKEWQPIELKGGETFKFEDEFTAKESMEVAEWAFHYGNSIGTAAETKYQHTDSGFPKGATIKFDNLSLIDTTSDENDWDTTNEFGVIRPKSNVRLNQVGYYTKLAKKASYVTDASEPLDWEVRDSSGSAVLKGKTEVFGADPDSGNGKTEKYTDKNGNSLTKVKDSGENVHIIDFSELQEKGTYTLFVKDTTGVKGTASGLTDAAYDTKISGDKVLWKNWKTGKEYTMNESCKFKVGDDIYDGLLTQAMSYYYQNRSNSSCEEKYVSGFENPDSKAPLTHTEKGHPTDTAQVQKAWIKSYTSEAETKTGVSVDGTGGWYDAGDHGKYAVNGGVSVWTLQNIYEYTKKLGTDSKWTDGKTVRIPEGGDDAPDVLDEARYELEWMMKMQVPATDSIWGSKCEGMVYHKLHDQKWTGLAIHAWKYEGFDGCVRIAKPPTYAASFNLAACGAQAARLWKGIDDKFADEALAAAEKAYAAVKKSGDGYKVKEGNWEKDPQFAPLDQAIGGGPYGDTYVMDDMYWAACELYITTGKDEYLTDLEAYENPNDSTGMDKAYSLTSNLGGGENKGSLSSFNWGCTSGLGTLSLYLNKDKLSADAAKTVESSIIKAGDKYVETEGKQGMGIPYVGSTFTDDINIGKDKNGKSIIVEGYEWGSNSFVINNAIVMAYAYDATADSKYINGASEAMDYIFGRNGLDFSYVSGWGETTLTYPHHRFWAGGIDPDFPLAPKGVLSGGPGAGMQDPYIGGLGYTRGTLANQKCYVDSAEAWSVNEITINWNAPLVWMSCFMDDVAAKGEIAPPTTSEKTEPKTQEETTTSETTTATTTAAEDETTTTTKTTTSGSNETSTKPTGKVTLWGDANCDEEVNLADAVLIMQSIANPDVYGPGKDKGIKPQGELNGDVDENGNGITNKDALKIQRYKLNLIKSLDPNA
jgi:endoglucanase